MEAHLEMPGGGRATIRHLVAEDAPDLLAAVAADRARLEYWLRWPHRVRDLDDARALIEAFQRGDDDRASMFGVFVADRLIGGCNLIRWRLEHARVELGVWVAPEAEGRGLMRVAAGAAIRYARRELGVERVEWRADIANERSRGLARRLGFVEELVARSFDVLGDRRFDVVRCSLVKSELDAF